MSASQAEIVSPNPKRSAESQAVIRTVDLTKVYPGGVKALNSFALGSSRRSSAGPKM
jgi:hypothetical protein